MVLCQEWYGIKHVSTGQTRSLVNINMLVLNPEHTNCVHTGGVHYLIVSLWQAPLFPETHLQKEAELTSKKLGKLKLVPKAPLLWMSLLAPSSLHSVPPGAQSLLMSPLPPPLLMGRLLYSDGDEEMTDVSNPSFLSLSSSPLAPSAGTPAHPIPPPLL